MSSPQVIKIHVIDIGHLLGFLKYNQEYDPYLQKKPYEQPNISLFLNREAYPKKMLA